MSYDRWNPPRETVPTPKGPLRVFVPGGESTGDTVVEPRGRTWGIRERGDRSGTVVHAYRCPVHGLFDVRVERADVPDEVACGCRASEADDAGRNRCGLTSPWAGSFCGQGHAAGEVTC